MASASYTLQAEITAKARAIRHLIGEQKALADQTARYEAELKLDLERYRAVRAPVATGGSIPSGDRFPDVSSYQPRVDLAAVSADSEIKIGQLIVLKATEGTGYTDGNLVSRWRGASGLFPHRGAYHFLHMNESGAAQAEYFLNELHRASDDGNGPKTQDIVICDAEVSDGESPATVAQCVAEFGAYLLGHCPAVRWLYTGGPFATENGIKLAAFHGHWLPAYIADPRPYFVFGTPIAWQYSDGIDGPTPHAVEGIGPCDMSIIL